MEFDYENFIFKYGKHILCVDEQGFQRLWDLVWIPNTHKLLKGTVQLMCVGDNEIVELSADELVKIRDCIHKGIWLHKRLKRVVFPEFWFPTSAIFMIQQPPRQFQPYHFF